MIRIGITGGIGSGKSYVAKIFAHLGVPIFNADLAGRRLINEDPAVIESIQKLFPQVKNSSGRIDRKILAQIVFNDKNKLAGLNEIIHPAVQQEYETWAAGLSTPYHMKEAAVMIESGSHKGLDKLILVIAPKDERIARVRKRDDAPVSAIEERMAHQLPDEEKIKFADFVIDNADGKMLLPQVLPLHKEFSSGKMTR